MTATTVCHQRCENKDAKEPVATMLKVLAPAGSGVGGTSTIVPSIPAQKKYIPTVCGFPNHIFCNSASSIMLIIVLILFSV